MAERWVRKEDGRARLANMFLATRDPDVGLRFMIDVVGQPRAGWEMGQLFALSCVFDLWVNQALAVIELPVELGPVRDTDRDENQARLMRLRQPFMARVDSGQRGAEGDGTLSWTDSIDASLHSVSEPHTIEYAASSAPLEIGSTDASTSLFHLVRFGALARYPYNHNVVTVLLTNPPNLLQRARMYAFEGGRDGSGTPTNGGAPILDDLATWANLLASARLLGKPALYSFEDSQFVHGGIDSVEHINFGDI